MRRQAREAVLRCLYRWEFLDLPPEELLAEEGGLGKERGFAQALLEGIRTHQPEIDRLIDQRAQGWGLDRLALVDRNILRLALFELLYTDTPPEVVIDEAVELAKEYGTEQAPKFINGILDRVWKERTCEPS
ncbi:transcription antitermination factor NusB [Candidatus Bipolaricaulota bacterium]|nr:transcription antitermination factor NusB [Candidatus Bipolaricaulota bacterium]